MNKLKKVIVTGVIAGSIAGGGIATDQIVLGIPGHIVMTQGQYQELKNNLANEYLLKKELTWQEYKTFVAIINKEAKKGKLKEIKNLDNKNIVNKMIKKIK